MRTSRIALLGAGVLGYVLLALLYPRFSPVADWRYRLDGAGAKAAAEGVAGRLGVDVRGWAVSIAALGAEAPAVYLRSTRPGPAIEQLLTPIHTHVLFAEPGGPRQLSVRLGADGRPSGFTRVGFTPDRPPAGISRDVGWAAVEALVGEAQAAALFAGRQRSSAAAGGGENEVFSSPAAGTTDFTLNATVQIRDGLATRAGIGPAFTPEFQQIVDRRNNSRVALGIGLVLVSLVLGAAALVFSFWSALRREAHYRSAVGLALLIVVVGLLPLGAGALDAIRIRAIGAPERIERAIESTRSEQQRQGAAFGARLGQVVTALRPVIGLVFVPFWFAGYALARRTSPERVVAARDFFSGRLLRRPVGAAIAAGVLLGGAVAAIPYLVVASGLAPAASLDRDGVDLLILTSPFPVLIAMTAFLAGGLLVIFGFAAPLVEAFVYRGLVGRAIVIVVGAVLLAIGSPFSLTVTGSIASGLLLALLAMAIYTRFDLLTVLAAGSAARIAIHAAALLVQPAAGLSASGLAVIAGLAAAGIAALVVARRGTPVDVAAAASDIAIQDAARSAGDRERLLAEFTLARRVQEQMLPPVPSTADGFGLAATCRPAREVGGDLYEFIPLGPHRFLVAVADVSGKGVPAALYMTLTKGLLGAVAEQAGDPDRIAIAVNEHLYEACGRKTFVTLALGVLDTSSRTFRYARAGHNPPIWRRTSRAETEMLRAPGIGLGLVGPSLFNRRTATESVDLDPADVVVLYSDGIVEAMNPAREEYGEERLIEAIERADHLDALSLRDALLADVLRFTGDAPAHDDMTLLVLKAGAA